MRAFGKRDLNAKAWSAVIQTNFDAVNNSLEWEMRDKVYPPCTHFPDQTCTHTCNNSWQSLIELVWFQTSHNSSVPRMFLVSTTQHADLKGKARFELRGDDCVFMATMIVPRMNLLDLEFCNVPLNTLITRIRDGLWSECTMHCTFLPSGIRIISGTEAPVWTPRTHSAFPVWNKLQILLNKRAGRRS